MFKRATHQLSASVLLLCSAALGLGGTAIAGQQVLSAGATTTQVTTGDDGRDAAGAIAGASLAPSTTVAAPTTTEAPTTTTEAPVTTTTAPAPTIPAPATTTPAPTTTAPVAAPRPQPAPAPPAPAPAPKPAPAPAPARPAMTPQQRVEAAYLTSVPAAWRSALTVKLVVIDGSTSWGSSNGTISVAMGHATGSESRLRATIAHEFGHLIAFRYGTHAFVGSAPLGWPTYSGRPEEAWADCVSQAFTGVVDPSHGLPACSGSALSWTASWLAKGPSRL